MTVEVCGGRCGALHKLVRATGRRSQREGLT